MTELLTANISMNTLIWLFLVVFIVHDLEEIIWVEPWIKKNKTRVLNSVPSKIQRNVTELLQINSSQFAVAVLLEFIVFIPFTYMAAEKSMYFMFLAFNMILFLHVFTHLGQSLYLKMYTPGVVTAVLIVLPYSIYLFYRITTEGLVSWNQVLLSIPVGVVLLPIVLIGHRIGKKIVPS